MNATSSGIIMILSVGAKEEFFPKKIFQAKVKVKSKVHFVLIPLGLLKDNLI